MVSKQSLQLEYTSITFFGIIHWTPKMLNTKDQNSLEAMKQLMINGFTTIFRHTAPINERNIASYKVVRRQDFADSNLDNYKSY